MKKRIFAIVCVLFLLALTVVPCFVVTASATSFDPVHYPDVFSDSFASVLNNDLISCYRLVWRGSEGAPIISYSDPTYSLTDDFLSDFCIYDDSTDSWEASLSSDFCVHTNSYNEEGARYDLFHLYYPETYPISLNYCMVFTYNNVDYIVARANTYISISYEPYPYNDPGYTGTYLFKFHLPGTLESPSNPSAYSTALPSVFSDVSDWDLVLSSAINQMFVAAVDHPLICEVKYFALYLPYSDLSFSNYLAMFERCSTYQFFPGQRVPVTASGSGSGSGSGTVTPSDDPEELFASDGTLVNFVFAIFQAPMVLLSSMLDFTIFGINLYGVLKVLLTLSLTALVIAVIVKLILHFKS